MPQYLEDQEDMEQEEAEEIRLRERYRATFQVVFGVYPEAQPGLRHLNVLPPPPA